MQSFKSTQRGQKPQTMVETRPENNGGAGVAHSIQANALSPSLLGDTHGPVERPGETIVASQQPNNATPKQAQPTPEEAPSSLTSNDIDDLRAWMISTVGGQSQCTRGVISAPMHASPNNASENTASVDKNSPAVEIKTDDKKNANRSRVTQSHSDLQPVVKMMHLAVAGDCEDDADTGNLDGLETEQHEWRLISEGLESIRSSSLVVDGNMNLLAAEQEHWLDISAGLQSMRTCETAKLLDEHEYFHGIMTRRAAQQRLVRWYSKNPMVSCFLVRKSEVDSSLVVSNISADGKFFNHLPVNVDPQSGGLVDPQGELCTTILVILSKTG